MTIVGFLTFFLLRVVFLNTWYDFVVLYFAIFLNTSLYILYIFNINAHYIYTSFLNKVFFCRYVYICVNFTTNYSSLSTLELLPSHFISPFSTSNTPSLHFSLRIFKSTESAKELLLELSILNCALYNCS